LFSQKHNTLRLTIYNTRFSTFFKIKGKISFRPPLCPTISKEGTTFDGEVIENGAWYFFGVYKRSTIFSVFLYCLSFSTLSSPIYLSHSPSHAFYYSCYITFKFIPWHNHKSTTNITQTVRKTLYIPATTGVDPRTSGLSRKTWQNRVIYH
jgi:hypothetical protein